MTPAVDLFSVEDARARLLGLARTTPVEDAGIEDAVGRALADGILAQRTLPPSDNSAMDGYAVRAADLEAERLRVIGTVAAGGRPDALTVEPGTCARIYTGAPIPKGADTVVMQERVEREGDAIRFVERPAPGANVRPAGEDARKGSLLLPRGTSIGVPEAAALWAQGLTRVRVHRRPRVAILSTGDELARVGEPPGDRIVDTNSPSLALAVGRAGGTATQLGIASDSLEAVIAKLREAITGFELVLTSAGVSVGDRDFIRPALDALGATSHLWRVAMKPGKPFALATVGDALIVSLPGNPASALVTFELFVRPALRRMLGHARLEPERISARLRAPVKKQAGLAHFVRATVAFEEGQLWATPLSSQNSGALKSLLGATHLISLPVEAVDPAAGQPIALIPVSWAEDAWTRNVFPGPASNGRAA